MSDDVIKRLTLDLMQVRQKMAQETQSDVIQAQTIAQYLCDQPSKHVRPHVMLCAARARSKHHDDLEDRYYQLAACLELLHVATLFHDDVLDHASIRRGAPTAHLIWGQRASILAGDFLYTRTFRLMVDHLSTSQLRLCANAIAQMIEGEIDQSSRLHCSDMKEQDYFSIIRRKTGLLFGLCAHLGYCLDDDGHGLDESPMFMFGCALGTAFQIMDDLLDYAPSDQYEAGKNMAQDAKEGKPSLVLIKGLKHEVCQDMILAMMHTPDSITPEKVTELSAQLKKKNVFHEVYQTAEDWIDQAVRWIDHVPPSDYQQELCAMGYRLLDRGRICFSGESLLQ